MRGFHDHIWTLRVVAVTAAAAGVAWALCLPFGTTPSAFAAASSVYAVQLNVRSSVVDGLKRSALMAVSLVLAVVILRSIGLSVWAVIVLVLVSVTAGRLLGLGVDGSLQIPATAIFVLVIGPSVTDWQLFTRALATLIGAVVGAAASIAAHAGDPQIEARRSIADVVRSMAGLLDDMSAGLTLHLTPAAAQEWLLRARRLDQQCAELRGSIDQAVQFLSWDPLDHRRDGAELSQLFTGTEHSVFQLRDIARTLFEASHGAKPTVVTPELAPLLQSMAAAFRLQAEMLEGAEPNLDRAVESVRTFHQESLRHVRQVDETGAWLMSGNILTDVDRMVQQMEGSAPALQVGREGRKRRRRRPRR